MQIEAQKPYEVLRSISNKEVLNAVKKVKHLATFNELAGVNLTMKAALFLPSSQLWA